MTLKKISADTVLKNDYNSGVFRFSRKYARCSTEYLNWVFTFIASHCDGLNSWQTDFLGSLVFNRSIISSWIICETRHRIFWINTDFALHEVFPTYVRRSTEYLKPPQKTMCKNLKQVHLREWSPIRAKSCEINCKYSKHLVSSTCSLLITKITKNNNHYIKGKATTNNL